MAPALRAAYRTCGELTRAASTTFYLSSLFLPVHKRRAIWAVYAFCRTADDLVDRTAPALERLAAVDALERSLSAAVCGDAADPLFVAYADASQRFGIPLGPALELLRGARMDISVARYATYAALCEYCYLVASTVGLLVAPVLGYAAPVALEYGIVLGRAMQLTNILRDVGEDASLGRIYLPGEDLERFGCVERRLFDGVVDDRFRALMRFQIARVRELYERAHPGVALLDPGSRYTVGLAHRLYGAILDSIEANDYDVFTRRAFVPLERKIRAAMVLALPRPRRFVAQR
ncbi:MAG: squalene/phytoene synthase family protein [Candidatus Eremiobacteraeota bacterium]|nr:squalene/phytoene synthase family protein [Candidatus Eremiobacteraeota bacterium]MBC5804465.1 squalene/phytoene synthase family protein [Candidatus Eremiobacteraeota bacterium]MBC5821222.1 squalene/phytoene synthase family protein [Candidatus Eremiobacteraeota bacterium]